MNTVTIVFCSLALSVLSVEAFTFYGLSPRSHPSPVSAWLNRNQAKAPEEEFRSAWISNTRLRSSKFVSPQTLVPSFDIKQNLASIHFVFILYAKNSKIII